MKLVEVLDVMIKKYEQENQGCTEENRMSSSMKLNFLKACKSNVEKEVSGNHDNRN